MSYFSLTLVLQIKTSKIINDMAKVSIKSEKIIALGGIFFVLDKSYTSEKTGNIYDFNTAEKLNQLLIKLLLATGQLTEGGKYDVDFDHQFLEAEKYDCKRTYKGQSIGFMSQYYALKKTSADFGINIIALKFHKSTFKNTLA